MEEIVKDDLRVERLVMSREKAVDDVPQDG